MHDESVRHMVLATACEIPTVAAYRMLQDDYLYDFENYYRQNKAVSEDGKQSSVLDALISFTLIRLPVLAEVDTSVLYNLRSKRTDIINSFLYDDTSELITRLASRKEVMNMIRKHLIRENSHASMYSKINDSRVSAVFTDFLEVFKMNCAHAFQFNGSFQEFVMHSFINFYYKGRKKDIWAMIREADGARRELEQNLVTERILPGVRHDDFKIHDLLLNIAVVNDLMFKHSGQGEGVWGVKYDIYYLILWTLCAERVRQINEALGEELLIMIDPLDRKEVHGDLAANKGISAKVQNAKELIPFIFSYVRNGKLNLNGLTDLRDKSFKLGKHDREGRNCIWADVQPGGETSHYLDTSTARTNYDNFNKVVKGVISVYTLMTELERRGYFLVDEYRSELFMDKSVIRYMDYYSSVQYIDLIKQLQAEPVDYNRYTSDLLTFDQMLFEYAGSEVNNHPNIRENRYTATVYGFINPKMPVLKQTTAPTTEFGKLNAVAMAMNAVPHTYAEYVLRLNKNEQVRYIYSTWIIIPASDISYGRYYALYYNSYLRDNPELASYYLWGNDKLAELGFGSTPNLRWSVGTADYSGIYMLDSHSVWLPLDEKFYFYGFPPGEEFKPFVATMTDVEAACNENRAQGRHLGYEPRYSPLTEAGTDNGWFKRMQDSIGFPLYIGIQNLGAQDVKSAMKKFPVYGKYRRYVSAYYDWLNENAQMQHSIVEVLKTMYVQCLCWCNGGFDTGIRPAQAESLLNGLATGSFDEQNLNWFLQLMHDKKRLIDLEWGERGKQTYRKIDRTVLLYCFNEVTDNPKDNLVYEDCLKLIENYDSPAKRFVAIYNHVCTKIEFLTLMRDSFSLLLTVVPTEMPTLVCELNSRFNIVDTIAKYTFSSYDFGIRLHSDATMDIKGFIAETRERCFSKFRSLLGAFTNYARSCEVELASLVNYNIMAQSDVASRFTKYGNLFLLAEPYEAVPELETLRKIATRDSAGFFLYNGKYFCGKGNNNIRYYVHWSGRLLEEVSGKLKPSPISPSDNKNRGLYRYILSRGFEDAG